MKETTENTHNTEEKNINNTNTKHDNTTGNENSSVQTDDTTQHQDYPPVEVLYQIIKESEQVTEHPDFKEKFKSLIQKSEQALKKFVDDIEHNEHIKQQLTKLKNIKVKDVVEESKKEFDNFKALLEETIEKMELHDKLHEAKEKVNELNDKFLRLYSEFDNYRKRTQKEKADLYKTAGEDVIKALLPVLDDFERALKAMDENNDPDHVKEGVKLIYNKLLNTLKQKGLEPMEDATGKEFNIEEHEAITRIPAPSDDMKGKVIDQVERGYKLNGKVIRYAKVVVGQ